MKRDFELIRKILLEVESSPAGSGPISIEFPGEYDQPTVNHHVDLLIDAGLINGKVIKGNSGIVAMALSGLTWAGHDFIDTASKDTLWRQALEIVKEKGGAVTLDILKELLKQLARNAIGLS
jgi:hypothetical protein